MELLLGRLSPAQALQGLAAQTVWLALSLALLAVAWRRACGATRRWAHEVLRLVAVYLRLGVLNELQYRANFFFQILQSALALVTALAGLGIVFNHTDRLGGWRPEELVALLGVYFLVGGGINFMLQPSMQRLMEDVRQGTLDFTLTKPADSQLLVSIRQVQVWKALDVLMGLGVLIVRRWRGWGRASDRGRPSCSR